MERVILHEPCSVEKVPQLARHTALKSLSRHLPSHFSSQELLDHSPDKSIWPCDFAMRGWQKRFPESIQLFRQE
jgi:hypothetical protein